MADRLADHRPFTGERVEAACRQLDRLLGGEARTFEVCEDHRQLGRASEVAPAALGLAVEALALERGEQQRPLGARAALVLDGAAERQQLALAQALRRELGAAAAQAGEDRRVDPLGRVARPRDGDGQRHACVALAHDAPDQLDILLGVAAVAARQPLRLGKPCRRSHMRSVPSLTPVRPTSSPIARPSSIQLRSNPLSASASTRKAGPEARTLPTRARPGGPTGRLSCSMPSTI